MSMADGSKEARMRRTRLEVMPSPFRSLIHWATALPPGGAALRLARCQAIETWPCQLAGADDDIGPRSGFWPLPGPLSFILFI